MHSPQGGCFFCSSKNGAHRFASGIAGRSIVVAPDQPEFFENSGWSEVYSMDAVTKNSIDPRPKRRKSKDNPYTIYSIGIESDAPRFYVSFRDG